MSIAESVQSQNVKPLKFESSIRKANFCSRLTLSYASSLVESVKLNKGKLANAMVEDMNRDPANDERLLAKFQAKLQANYEKWTRSHPGRSALSQEW